MNFAPIAQPQLTECAGLLVRAISTSRVLLLQRPSGVWEQPGGHREGLEDLRATALREFREETGFHGHLAVGSRGVETGMGGVRYVVYPAYVDREFRPELTEHIGFRWVDGELPASTHPGVEKALREL